MENVFSPKIHKNFYFSLDHFLCFSLIIEWRNKLCIKIIFPNTGVWHNSTGEAGDRERDLYPPPEEDQIGPASHPKHRRDHLPSQSPLLPWCDVSRPTGADEAVLHQREPYTLPAVLPEIWGTVWCKLPFRTLSCIIMSYNEDVGSGSGSSSSSSSSSHLHLYFKAKKQGVVVAQWVRPQTLNHQVTSSNVVAAVVPLGKALYPHVPWKGLKAVGSLVVCL